MKTFELRRAGDERVPISGDEPPVPGARLRCELRVDGSSYRNIWVVDAESADAVAALSGLRVANSRPAEFVATESVLELAPRSAPVRGAVSG